MKRLENPVSRPVESQVIVNSHLPKLDAMTWAVAVGRSGKNSEPGLTLTLTALDAQGSRCSLSRVKRTGTATGGKAAAHVTRNVANLKPGGRRSRNPGLLGLTFWPLRRFHTGPSACWNGSMMIGWMLMIGFSTQTAWVFSKSRARSPTCSREARAVILATYDDEVGVADCVSSGWSGFPVATARLG